MTLTKEAKSALEIQAMLNGVTLEDIANEMFDEEEEIIIEDEEPKKKKSKKTKKEEEPKPVTLNNVDELDMFKKLHNSKPVTVAFNGHEVEYKNQMWPIPAREVQYKTEVIKNRKSAKDIAELFAPKSEEDKQKASDGTVRYIKLTTYTEAINFRIRNAGYAKVWDDNGKLRFKILMNKELKDRNVNVESVKRDFKDVLNEIIS